MLPWAGVEIIFFTAAGKGLYFGIFVGKSGGNSGMFSLCHAQTLCKQSLHIVNAALDSHISPALGSVWLTEPGGVCSVPG